ncbi:MAG TPA: hypothetical protein DCP25_16560 [Chloroflexi bacterium]|nr:hypothetical protein [Chloroflexota bacterium]
MLSQNCSTQRTANKSTAATEPRHRAEPNAKSSPTAYAATEIASVARNGTLPNRRTEAPCTEWMNALVIDSTPSAASAGVIRCTEGRRARAARSNTAGISARNPSRSTWTWCALLACRASDRKSGRPAPPALRGPSASR